MEPAAPLPGSQYLGAAEAAGGAEVEEGQREKGRETRPSDPRLTGGRPRAPTRSWLGNASYRQPEAVLLFLRRLQGRQSPEVLLHVRLLHLVIG